MRIAAARELFEESGIWLGSPLEQPERHRQSLLERAVTFASIAASAAIDPERLVWTSRWITPAGVPKRFDTYFFLTEVDHSAVATPENSEAVEVIWISPADALRKEAEGTFSMVFPTIRNLEALTGFDSVAPLIASRRGIDIPTTRPILEDDHGRTRIVFP
jgi:8-oxo-dGTP pyrophosphatase MutT (NUDIX family)